MQFFSNTEYLQYSEPRDKIFSVAINCTIAHNTYFKILKHIQITYNRKYVQIT